MITPDEQIENLFRLREYLIEGEKMRSLVGRAKNAECDANIMLAFRHLEDCRMRLGKAIQALNGGKSAYPR